MAAGMRALARKNGISGEIEETMEIRFGESERSELRSVPSISEQMALKIMDDWIEEYGLGLITNLGNLLRLKFKNPGYRRCILLGIRLPGCRNRFARIVS